MSKKKSDAAKALDELRDEDPKKRLAAVQELRDIASALGPAKVRSDLIGFLACISTSTQNSLMMRKISFLNFSLSFKDSQLSLEE